MEAASAVLLSHPVRTFFQQLYNTADAIIVGKYVGKEALAAVGGTMAAMGTPDLIMAYATQYIRIYFVGIIPNLIYNMGAGILRAIGDSIFFDCQLHNQHCTGFSVCSRPAYGGYGCGPGCNP